MNHIRITASFSGSPQRKWRPGGTGERAYYNLKCVNIHISSWCLFVLFTSKSPERASANCAKQILLLCCMDPDCIGTIRYSLRTSYVMLCVDILGKNTSSVSARRTVATVVGPPNVPAIAAFSGCIRSLKSFFAYDFMSSHGTN